MQRRVAEIPAGCHPVSPHPKTEKGRAKGVKKRGTRLKKDESEGKRKGKVPCGTLS